MRPTKYTKSLLLLTAGFASLVGNAQDAATAAAPASASAPAAASTDYYMYVLVAMAFVLLVAIAVLGQVLIRLTVYVYEKKATIAKSLLLFLMLAAGGFSAYAQDAVKAAAPAAAQTPSVFTLDFIVAISVVLIEAFVIFVLLIRIMANINIIYPPAKAKEGVGFAMPRWFDKFNESVAIENEKDIMLDHDYDGIKELDNQLPPWWKYGFILTIIWAFAYLFYFHVMEAAPLSGGEYANEMEAAKIAKEAYMRTAKNNVDENTIKFDQAYVADGQKIYTDNCVACHGDKGQGGVGPNLTDEYWLHGGKINDVFKTVKYGWPANGMKAWQTDLSSTQIAQVVCYVKTLKGTKPANPKAPQGDLYNEDGAKTDSTATAATTAKDSVGK
jgi:cytochrome c oxidase cbb3-type subunit 3